MNCALANKYFYGDDDDGQLLFRKKLAHELIFNSYLEEETKSKRQSTRTRLATDFHRLESLPKGKNFPELQS